MEAVAVGFPGDGGCSWGGDDKVGAIKRRREEERLEDGQGLGVMTGAKVGNRKAENALCDRISRRRGTGTGGGERRKGESHR